MASWVLAQLPWLTVRRARRPLDLLTRTVIRYSQNHIQFQGESPAAEALKRHPYPSHGPDLSVFEELSEEYNAIETSSSIPATPRSSVETLLHLVEQMDYKSAESVLADLRRMDFEIPFDARYEKAAVAALALPQGKIRTMTFVNWFSLYPPAHAFKPRSFHTICQKLLLSTMQPDLSLVMRFGLICASKGYGRKVYRNIAPFVIRFTHATFSRGWIKKFESLTLDYMRKHDKTTSENSMVLKSFRDLAIRAHCSAGRTDEASRIFEESMNQGIPISEPTAALLTKALQRVRNSPSATQYFDNGSVDMPFLPMPQHDPLKGSAELELVPLPVQLQRLKSSIASNDRPPPRALVIFMRQYRAIDRSRALLMLRRRAFQHSPQSISVWVLAEMIYYLDQERCDKVLSVFANYCHIVGVSRAPILTHLSLFGRAVMDRRIDLPPRLLRDPYPITEKLYPTRHHTTIVWRALIHLTKTVYEFIELYQQFIHIARMHLNPPPPPDSEPEVIPPPAQAIDDIHFNSFIFGFRQRFGPYHSLTLLQDMRALGLQPNYFQLATLAEGFAYAGDAPKTIKFLNDAEASYRLIDPGEPEPYPSLLGMYTNILRSLVTTRRLDDALEVERRLMRNTSYTEGSNEYTDTTRSFLHERRQQMSRRRVKYR